jgi:hypothetical protein
MKETTRTTLLDIGWRIILKWTLRVTEWGGMDCIHLSQDRGKWQALVNRIMKLQAHTILRNS